MSISVVEVKDSLSAQIQVSDDFKTSISATRKFLVTNSSPLTEAQVLSSGPFLGSTHPSISSIFCYSKTAEPIRKDLTGWVLVCNYKNFESSGYNQNPLLRPPQISWSSVSYEEDFIKDIAGKAVLNSAGDYFDPPIKVQRSKWQVNYTRNIASVPAWILNYSNSINSDTFLLDGISIPKGCAFLEQIQIGPVKVENGYVYREISYSFLLQPESWQPKILDQGLYEKDDGGNKTRIRIGGEPVTEPVLLDGKGKPLQNPSPDNAVFLPFKAYRELPFGAIL